MQQELDLITKVQAQGYVLVDFPKSLNQAKMLEQHISGFVCMTDQERSVQLEQFERWSKLVSPNTTTASDFDGEVAL